MTSKIWLSSPHIEDSQILEAHKTSYNDSSISVFENKLAEIIGENSYVAALSSGTAAIHIALILCGVKRNDEVLCQSFTFCATANPILYLGAKPVFIDSENDTWNMCPLHLENAIIDRIKISKKPKALIFVNTYGMPAKIKQIIDVAKKYDIKVIEDAAEALGSYYKETKSGSFGDFSIISFNTNKIVTTTGGGALICRNHKDKIKAQYYASQAKDAMSYYHHRSIGYNYKLSNILASIGVNQLKVLSQRVKQRRANHDFYSKLFKDSEHIVLFNEPDNNHFSNHWLSCIQISKKANFSKIDVINKLNENNIESRHLWNPLHLQPIFKKHPYYGSKNSKALFDSGVCLPSSSNMTDNDKKRISKVLSQFVNM